MGSNLLCTTSLFFRNSLRCGLYGTAQCIMEMQCFPRVVSVVPLSVAAATCSPPPHPNPPMLTQILDVLCAASEYNELPVRHNEDRLNQLLAKDVRWKLDSKHHSYEDPHTKANLLIQAHLGRVDLPISDYVTDTKSVLDNSVRLCQALVDVAAEAGDLRGALGVMGLIQGCMQVGRWNKGGIGADYGGGGV